MRGGQADPPPNRASAEPLEPPGPHAARRNPAYNPPSRITVGKANGLHVSWFVYRGPGKVTFDRPSEALGGYPRGYELAVGAALAAPHLPPDNKVEVQVTFSEPGTYVLRAAPTTARSTRTKRLR